jgi:hypothetical protein
MVSASQRFSVSVFQLFLPMPAKILIVDDEVIVAESMRVVRSKLLRVALYPISSARSGAHTRRETFCENVPANEIALHLKIHAPLSFAPVLAPAQDKPFRRTVIQSLSNHEASPRPSSAHRLHPRDRHCAHTFPRGYLAVCSRTLGATRLSRKSRRGNLAGGGEPHAGFPPGGQSESSRRGFSAVMVRTRPGPSAPPGC